MDAAELLVMEHLLAGLQTGVSLFFVTALLIYGVTGAMSFMWSGE